MAVLFGLFLFMGFTSLQGNQFSERLALFVTDPALYPKTSYTRRVPHKWIHIFTLIQLICFIILWILKASKLGILFPLMIAALVPINVLMEKIFPPQYIKVLEAEEDTKADDKHTFD